jgi:thiol-disulfide isomerase/thioredoxin
MRRLLGAAAVVLLAGCGTPEITASPSVDVDTPVLRQLKQRAGIADCPATHGASAGQGLPEVTLPCLGGGRDVDLSELKGPLVVNLWAQWCGPCRAELPLYQAFSEKYAGRVDVLGVDWNDTQPRRALELARETGVRYPLVADSEPAIRGQVLPRILLIDAEGDVVHDEAVEITSVAQLEDLVAEHLGVS